MTRIAAADIAAGLQGLTDDLSQSAVTILMSVNRDKVRLIVSNIKGGDFAEARALTSELKFTDSHKLAKAVRKYTRSSALLGAGAIDSPRNCLWAQGAPYPFEVDVSAVRLIIKSLTSAMAELKRKLDGQITAASQYEHRYVVVKAEQYIDPDQLAIDINRFLRGEIRRVVEASSNVVGTRVSAFGMLHEARVRGISRYRLDATLDDRTTEICQHLDGRTFEVDRSYELTASLLAIQDPAELKTKAPFPDLDKIKKLTNAELQDRGIAVPPFHFLCRTVVVLIENQVEAPPVDLSAFPDVIESPSRDSLEAAFDQYNDMMTGLLGVDIKPGVVNTAMRRQLRVDSDSYSALYTYTGPDYREINYALRSNTNFRLYSYRDSVIEIDKLFDMVPVTTEAQITYRGVSTNNVSRMEVGKVFQDDGLVSTTIHPGAAADWKGPVLQIYVPPGSKMLPVENVTASSGEWEILLPRGTQYRVISKSELFIDGTLRTVVRAVFQGVGEVLPAADIGLKSLPTPLSVIKTTASHWADKFAYQQENDLREASFSS